MRDINPGYKLLSLTIASLLLSLTYNIKLNVIICIICLILAAVSRGTDVRKLLKTMIPFALAAFGMFMAGFIAGKGQGGSEGVVLSAFGQRTLFASDLKTALQLSSRILAYGGIGILFAFTTNSFELVMSLMQQFHLPAKFAYGVLGAYHFFPVIREEFTIVGNALRVRGVKAGTFSTKRVIPMFVQAIERSSSLAMAMESRGFEDGSPRATAFKVPLRKRDIVFLIVPNVLIVLGLVYIV